MYYIIWSNSHPSIQGTFIFLIKAKKKVASKLHSAILRKNLCLEFRHHNLTQMSLQSNLASAINSMTKLQHFSKIYDNPYYNHEAAKKLKLKTFGPTKSTKTHLQRGNQWTCSIEIILIPFFYFIYTQIILIPTIIYSRFIA